MKGSNENVMALVISASGESRWSSASSTGSMALALSLTGVNDNPIVTVGGTQLTYTEGGAAGIALTGITISDADTASLAGATVSITAGKTTGDVLAFTNDGSTMGSISGTYTHVEYITAR